MSVVLTIDEFVSSKENYIPCKVPDEFKDTALQSKSNFKDPPITSQVSKSAMRLELEEGNIFDTLSINLFTLNFGFTILPVIEALPVMEALPFTSKVVST